ncbi:MAG: IclR family transcriptional regulator C-terminal domain-containing protein [Pseudomonadota bacterium]
MANEKAEESSGRSDFVTALARGLSVIEAFSADAPELTLTEVATRAGMAPATARRALITLQQLGYVGLTGKRFVLRPKVLSLGSAFLSSMNLRELAQPYLQELADQFRDSASLAVLDGDNIMYIAHVPNNRRIRYNGSVGYRSPAFGTSLGLAMWAYLDPQRLEAALAKAPFPAYTSKTINTAEQLRSVIAKVRENGYATAQEQLEYDIVAIAVPVRDMAGNVIGAVNCSSELTRNDQDTLIATRLEPLRETARQIERGLQRFPALAHAIATT